MKKVFITMALIAVTLWSADAQGWFIGGSMGFWTGDDQESATLNADYPLKNHTSFSLLPDVGHHFNEHWSVAMALGYSGDYYSYQHCDKKDHSSAFLVCPYVLWTFYKKGMVSVFLDGAVNLAFGENVVYDKVDLTQTKTHYTGFQVGVKPCIALTFNEHWCAIAGFGFLGYSNGEHDQWMRKGFGLNLNGSTTKLGFYYNF